mgnify:CR=1 FL=1
MTYLGIPWRSLAVMMLDNTVPPEHIHLTTSAQPVEIPLREAHFTPRYPGRGI